MGPYSSYDLVGGLERVILLFLLLTFALLGIMGFQLYRKLENQDSPPARGTSADVRSQALLIAKRAILWVFGHKGDHREKTPISRAGLNWVVRYQTSIVLRLVPVYGLYILILVVFTRPIYLSEGVYHSFNYLPKLRDLFVLFVIYVSSNILFDYISLRFTFSCIIEAIETRRYTSTFIKNISFAALLFLVSQVISCILWIYKRQDPSFPTFNNSMFYNFLEVSLWPYAFVTGPGSSQINSEPFPGQLLITGTVFIPTVTVSLVFVIFSAFLKVAELIKMTLRSHKLDQICRLFLMAKLIGIFEPQKTLKSFGYCNLAFLALLELSIASGAAIMLSRIF